MIFQTGFCNNNQKVIPAILKRSHPPQKRDRGKEGGRERRHTEKGEKPKIKNNTAG